MKSRVAVIGGGPAGCAFSCFYGDMVTVFEQGEPLKTLLCTGGGRCNLAHAIFDFKELSKNYPRGEKFLYSVFSKFSTNDTISFFKSIGVETYTQDDGRIFPKSNDAKMVCDAILKQLKNNTEFIREKVVDIKKTNGVFIINDKYEFDKVVISTGGHAGYKLAESLGHEIVEPKPSLVGLITKEKFSLAGVSLRNIKITYDGLKKPLTGDILFTDKGISGPLAYIISSLFARVDYSSDKPLKLHADFEVPDLIQLLNENGKKDVKTMISKYMPKSVSEYICSVSGIENKKCHEISKELRQKFEKYLRSFPITVIGHENHGEVVTSGGIDLKEINSKTMESKVVEGLYFCGEVIDVDGFCGGFNLQNAWSTAYVAASSLKL